MIIDLAFALLLSSGFFFSHGFSGTLHILMVVPFEQLKSYRYAGKTDLFTLLEIEIELSYYSLEYDSNLFLKSRWWGMPELPTPK